MKSITIILVALIIIKGTRAPPVTSSNPEVHEDDGVENLEAIHYAKYLKEVVELLEKDEHFSRQLRKASEQDIRSGKIAEELNFVHHSIRSKLDEKKRHEIERLRELTAKIQQLDDKVLGNDYKDHLVAENPNFEIEDIKRLINKTTETLKEADKTRKEEYKIQKMEEQLEEEEKLVNMTDTEKYNYVQDQRKKEAAQHKNHPPVHHPGSKQQLEEVWEKQDHMDQDIDPKVFFAIHDLDGNGLWDQDEVKALFVKELDKIYDPKDPKAMADRYEDMERMREHVFHENDHNRDGFISYEEFEKRIQAPDFQRDEGWKSVSENEIYTPEEYAEFQRRHEQQGRHHGRVHHQNVPVPPQYHDPQYYPQVPHQGYQGYQQGPGQLPHNYPDPNYQQIPNHQQPPQGYHPAQDYQKPQGIQQPQSYQSPQSNNQPPPSNQQISQGNQQPQGHQQPVQGYQQPVQGYQQPIQGYQQPIQGYQQPIQGNQQPLQSNQQPQHYQPPQTNNQPQSIQQLPNYQPAQPITSNQNQPVNNQIQQEQGANQPQEQNVQYAQPQKKPPAGQNVNSYQPPSQQVQYQTNEHPQAPKTVQL